MRRTTTRPRPGRVGFPIGRGSLAEIALWVLAVVTVDPGAAHAQSMVEAVARPGILAKGEGRVSFGAGTYLRENGSLTAGQLDLRLGLADRIELRFLLPGIAGELLRETDSRPGVIGFLGMSELGFSSIHGSTLGYQLGVRVTKRLHPRLRLSFNVELRHRLLGQESAELAIIGPMPPNRAGLFVGDALVQLHPMLAISGSLGYALSIGDDRSFGYGSLGVVASFARRLDLFTHFMLERSRPDRIFAPAFFGGLMLSF